MADPTPLEYDEPIEHVEWGVVVTATGERAGLLDEATARLTTRGRDDLLLVKRTVLYQPWTVVAHD